MPVSISWSVAARIRLLFVRPVAIAGLLTMLAGCGEATRKHYADDEALQQIREQVDGQRQCAPLLSGSWPIEFSADALASPKVDALVAAGLVRRVPVDAAGDRPRTRIEPTPSGLRDIWLRRLDPGSPPEPFLCFGRKHVVAVHTERRDIGAETGPQEVGDVLRYDYRIVQPPKWTGRADIRAAFPFLPVALNRVVTAEQVATRSGEGWSLPADTGKDVGAELPPDQGFFPDR